MPVLPTLIFLAIATPSTAQACTVAISHGLEGVIVGNNEDWFKTRAKVWYEPPNKHGPHGALLFGFEGGGRFAQGGVNDAGLFFDGLGIDRVELLAETREGRRAAPVHLFRTMLHQAGTVEEALAAMEPYFIPYIKHAQMVVADRHGTVAVLNVNGVTLHEQVAPGTYRVISNAPVEGPWEATEAILGVPEACEALEADLGVGGMTHALEATHQESRVQSIYSTVFDLERGRVEIYYLYDYANPWTVDLAEPPEAGVFIRLREHFAARFEQVHAERAAQ